MDRISLQIKLLYDKMGKAEKRIADGIFENPGKIISLSIIELAEQCECGEATIVRFAKRLNLNEELTRAIATAHDLGHAPFGHHGEDIIKKLSKKYLDKYLPKSALFIDFHLRKNSAIKRCNRINNLSISFFCKSQILFCTFNIPMSYVGT